MKSLTSLWSCTAHEMAVRCRTSATNDVKTVVSRTEHEGLSFLAITLADFGKAIQKWLDQGFVAPWDVPSFKKNRLTGLPVFLQGFLGRVFDPVSGTLLDDPDIEAIFALRQLTLMFSKIALPQEDPKGTSTAVVTPRRERRAMSDFVQIEHDVKFSDSILDPQFLEEFKAMSGVLFGDLFAKVDRDIHWGRIVFKHGPGATADRLSSNAKWSQRTWTNRLQSVFPADQALQPNLRVKEKIDIIEPGAEIPVRVITVPKTLKTPRIIAIEPTVMQYAQQGVLRSLLDAFREDSFLSRIIGFDDQTPNQRMASRGSRCGDLATLDMSEASDRVSNQHVRAMLEDYPELLRMVDGCRSRKAEVPGHGVIRLAKFASMGSALCFPFEAMVFATLIFMGIQRELREPLCRSRLIKQYSDQVRVFGDDIIVPREHVLSVVDELSTFGYKVNVGKSFWIGRFRESCGKEYYDGHDVSIVKVRMVLPTRRQDASGVISAVALRNRLYWAGLWQSARWMDDYIEKVIKHFPNVAPTSPLLGRETALGYQFQRLHPFTHGPLAKGYYVSAKPPRDHLEGSGALLKCLNDQEYSGFGLPKPEFPVHISNCDIVDVEHLERSGRPERVDIKLGWRSPF
jgi:hypothetical protein